MIPNEAFSPQVVIQSVNFQPGIINIQYAEERETNDFVSIGRSLVVDVEQIPDELAELDELLRDVIDKALLLLRNPPKKIRSRAGGTEAETDDEADSD